MSLKRPWEIIKAEAVLILAALAAIVSMLFVPPDVQYLEYVDPKVLSLLLSLMTVVAGFQDAGLFDALAQWMIRGAGSIRKLTLSLVFLCFFSSMLITNDVALITFVPFTLLVLGFADAKKLIYVVVLETIAANPGSSLTPMGNPQNLFLYAHYSLSAGQFMHVTLPFVALSALLLLVLCVIPTNKAVTVSFAKQVAFRDSKRPYLYAILFAVSIAGVLGVLSHWIVLGVVLLSVAIAKPRLLARVDYSLLITFVCFFIFVGNVGRIESIQKLTSGLIAGRELLFSAALSQLISNVPAAVMLSAFTDQSAALIAGTNIGGLGTLIASLASLISFKYYNKYDNARPGLYLIVFTVLNVVFLAVLLPAALLINR